MQHAAQLAAFFSLLFCFAAVANTTDQVAPTEQQWNEYFTAEEEATKQRLERLEAYVRELRDQIKDTQRDRDLDLKTRRERVGQLRQQYDKANQDLEMIERGELFTTPNVFQSPKLGAIGQLNFRHQYNDGTIRLINSINDQSGLYELVYSRPNYSDSGTRVANTWHTAGPYWITNEHNQVKDANGTFPDLTGIFIVAKAKRIQGEQVPHYIAIDSDLDAERTRWVERMKTEK